MSPLRRRIAALVLGTAAPLLFVAELTAMGHHAAAAAAVPARHAVALTNPVQCLLEDAQCAKAAASGDACDPIPC